MNIRDTLLDLDLGPTDCLYRFRRDEGNTKRVIYVHVTDIRILPEESRTSNDEVVLALSKLNGWHDKWDTLTVLELNNEVQCFQDHFKAHALPPEKLLGEYPFFNILDLRPISSKKPRVTYVDTGSEQCYLKIARFGFELEWISRELEAYHALAHKNPRLGPRLLGYVFEGSKNRVIGFLLKALPGRPACVTDGEVCEKALQELHASGLIHGDPVKANILITSQGVKFIDFENSVSQPQEDLEQWNAMKEQEVCNLKENLMDSSKMGQSWD